MIHHYHLFTSFHRPTQHELKLRAYVRRDHRTCTKHLHIDKLVYLGACAFVSWGGSPLNVSAVNKLINNLSRIKASGCKTLKTEQIKNSKTAHYRHGLSVYHHFHS